MCVCVCVVLGLIRTRRWGGHFAGDPLKFAQGRGNNNASILQKAEQLRTSLLALFPLLPVSFLSMFSLCHNKNPFLLQIWVKFEVLGFLVSICDKMS